jgi:hypothetical protein
MAIDNIRSSGRTNFVVRIARRIGLIEDRELKQAKARLEELLCRQGSIRLESFMYIDFARLISPERGEPILTGHDISQVRSTFQRSFGINANFVNSVKELFRKDPQIINPVLSKLEELLPLMDRSGFSPRELIPALQAWIVGRNLRDIRTDPKQLIALLDHVRELLARGIDPAKRLMVEAMQASSIIDFFEAHLLDR